MMEQRTSIGLSPLVTCAEVFLARRDAFAWLCAGALSGLPMVGSAATVTVGASRDTTLYESTDGSLGNGAGQAFVVGRTNTTSSSIRRALVAFDLSSAVPAGATVTSAALTLTATISSSDPASMELHRVLRSWGEGTSDAGDHAGQGASAAPGDATWLYASYNTATWTSAGGDFVTTSSATALVDQPESYVWTSPQLVADVRAMIANPAGNAGWVLLGDESIGHTTKTFASRENATAGNRPTLTITYSPVNAAGMWELYR